MLELPQAQDLPICGAKVPEPPQRNCGDSMKPHTQAVYEQVYVSYNIYTIFFKRMEMQIHLTLLNLT